MVPSILYKHLTPGHLSLLELREVAYTLKSSSESESEQGVVTSKPQECYLMTTLGLSIFQVSVSARRALERVKERKVLCLVCGSRVNQTCILVSRPLGVLETHL